MGDNDPFMRNQNAAVQGRAKAQNRANVLQLKMIGQNHPTGLTSNLLKLFEPRPPLQYKPPPEKRKCPPYTGMAHLVSHFAEPSDPEYAPPVPKAETPAEKRARIHQFRLQKGAEKVAEELKKYDPNSDPNIAGDPYKTLFVAKLSYETTESRLKREFESYGPIKRVGTRKKPRSGFDSQKPRGYAFIEYMHTRDMKAAYKQGDGKKIDGRRVLVDVERGRTVPNWRPRRLGGGLGTSRISGEDGSQRNSVREQQQPGGPSRSEEPRAREDRPDREKSRERARDKDVEREKSRERSHDKPRERDREDRHRDRDRRDRGHDRDRDRDRGSRSYDRDRTRDRDRDHRRDRTRDRERDYEVVDRDKDRDVEYESKHERHSKRDHKSYEAEEDEGEWHRNDYEQYEHHRGERGSSRYDNDANDGYDHYNPNEAHHHRYDQMDQDDYHYGRASSKDKDQEERLVVWEF